VMPCSSLVSPLDERGRRSVSFLARRIESVIADQAVENCPASTCRLPAWSGSTTRRARKPSLSASRIATSETSGRSSPSRSRLMRSVHRTRPAQSGQQLHRSRVSIRSASNGQRTPTSVLVAGQVFGHAFRQRRHQHALIPLRTVAISASRSSIWPFTGRILHLGIYQPVGRITCSTTTPLARQLVRPGVAET